MNRDLEPRVGVIGIDGVPWIGFGYPVEFRPSPLLRSFTVACMRIRTGGPADGDEGVPAENSVSSLRDARLVSPGILRGRVSWEPPGSNSLESSSVGLRAVSTYRTAHWMRQAILSAAAARHNLSRGGHFALPFQRPQYTRGCRTD